MTRYIHQLAEWPKLTWDRDALAVPLADIRYRQGRLLGRMESLGFSLQQEAELETLTLDVVKSSEIEGENLNTDQVRSSIARRLGIDIAGAIPANRNVEGVVPGLPGTCVRRNRGNAGHCAPQGPVLAGTR